MGEGTTIYKAECAGFRMGEETSLSIIFRGESEDDAIQQAAKFLRNRCESLDLRAGAITVSYLTISRILEDGTYQTRTGIPFFEWKYDTSPYTITNLIEVRDARRQTR